jgi:hypothetical protein
MSTHLRKLFIMPQSISIQNLGIFGEEDKAFFFDFQVEPVLDKLEKSKPCGPRVSVSWTDGAQTALTTFRQWPPLPCPCPRLHRHRFPAATPPTSTAFGSYKGRPPPTPTVEHPFFLLHLLPPTAPPFPPPQIACSGLSPTDLTMP